MVVPSRCQDAGPLVPLESMAAGTPVVAYANGGLGEYVADAGGGRVVPQDVVALADAAREIHDDAKLWATLSLRGRQSVAERHTAAEYAESLEKVYEDAAG
jgi:glycosyltransferase involved in cell wall biosynthesis